LIPSRLVVTAVDVNRIIRKRDNPRRRFRIVEIEDDHTVVLDLRNGEIVNLFDLQTYEWEPN
jgi:hypothetical protein